MIEQQVYEVLAEYSDFELRRYPDHLVAETEGDGPFELAGSVAFPKTRPLHRRAQPRVQAGERTGAVPPTRNDRKAAPICECRWSRGGFNQSYCGNLVLPRSSSLNSSAYWIRCRSPRYWSRTLLPAASPSRCARLSSSSTVAIRSVKPPRSVGWVGQHQATLPVDDLVPECHRRRRRLPDGSSTSARSPSARSPRRDSSARRQWACRCKALTRWAFSSTSSIGNEIRCTRCLASIGSVFHRSTHSKSTSAPSGSSLTPNTSGPTSIRTDGASRAAPDLGHQASSSHRRPRAEPTPAWSGSARTVGMVDVLRR